MDKKSVTETAADTAKVAVGIAAMAVDARMGTDRAAEGAAKKKADAAPPQPQDGARDGGAPAPAASASPSDVTDAQARNSSGAIDINKAKFDELVSLKHIGRGRA